jgi:cell division protease FtsH
MAKLIFGYTNKENINIEEELLENYNYELECNDSIKDEIIVLIRNKFETSTNKRQDKEKYDDFLPEGKSGFFLIVDDKVIKVKEHHNASNEKFLKADIRRVIAYIILRKDIDSITIKWGGKKWVYTDIETNIKNQIDGNKVFFIGKIKFVDCNGESKQFSGQGVFCIPINSSENNYKMLIDSTPAFYMLEYEDVKESTARNESKLMVYDQVIVNREGISVAVDRFYGYITENNVKKYGLFFYWNGKSENKSYSLDGIYSKYVVENIDKKIHYEFSDIKYCVYHNEISIYKIANGESKNKATIMSSLRVNKDSEETLSVDEGFKNEVTIFEKNEAKMFESNFEHKIIKQIIKPVEAIYYIDKDNSFKCKKEEDIYEFDKEDFSYKVKANEQNKQDSDYKEIKFNELGAVVFKKENATIEFRLADFMDEWVVRFKNDRIDVLNSFDTINRNTKIGTNRVCFEEVNNVKQVFEKIEKSKSIFENIIAKYFEMTKNNEKLEHLQENSLKFNESQQIAIKNILFPSPDIANEIVVSQITEAKKLFERNKKIPNLAIMGGPGTGKSTLVKKIAECFKGKASNGDENVEFKSSSDLKGAYVGHTAARVFELLKNADRSGKIVFIDEAYNLQGDQFGKEALEILLPLLSGDRKTIQKPIMKSGEEKEETYTFENVPPIWLAGYEHEMRKMLSQNPGLYRRMLKISLSAPNVNGLFENLKGLSKDENCKNIYNECEKDIKNYFGWATSQEFVDYFGNFAGVKDFEKSCSIRLNNEMTKLEKKECIYSIIDEKKSEIKKQYKAILTNIEKKYFETQSDIETTFAEVKGAGKAVENLKDIVNMLTKSQKFLNQGIVVPKGALLVGPPGTGKTLLARAVAGEVQKNYREKENKDLRVAFISTVSTELNNTNKIETLFREAEEYDTCIIFIDEIDIIGKHRSMSGASSDLLIQLLKEMDGFSSRKNIFVMAASNAPDVLDPALKRPGRFDRIIEVSYPDKDGREEIINFYLQKMSFLDEEDNVDVLSRKIAKETLGFSPSELKNLINESSILYMKYENRSKESEKGTNIINHRNTIKNEKSSIIERFECDIMEMLERKKIGEINYTIKEKEFSVQENEGSSAVAIHEVGHALVSILSGFSPFEKITIISRGEALGYVDQNRQFHPKTKSQFLKQIRICLGGRVAEELFYGENISTGAVTDIQQATKIAENMIALYGMSEVIGPMALKYNYRTYLGDTNEFICSDEFRFEMDKAIRNLLREQMGITRNLLEMYKSEIEKMAKHVFIKETVTGEEFEEEYKKISTMTK